GLVGVSVGIKDDMDHRVLQHQRMKSQFCSQCRGQIDYCGHAVHVRVGLLAGCLSSVDRQIAHLHLSSQGNSMEGLEFNFPSSSSFESANNPIARHLLK